MQEALKDIKNLIIDQNSLEVLLDEENLETIMSSYDISDEEKQEIIDFIQTKSLEVINETEEQIKAEENEESVLPQENTFISDSIRQYLVEINKIKLLTEEEEVELFTKIKKNKKELKVLKKLKADDSIINDKNEELKILKHKAANANLRLVVSVARKYYNCGVAFLDLVQEGNIGLLAAVDKFDIDKGFKFSTYATWWIRQHITRSIADTARTIRIPVHMNEKFAVIHNQIKAYENKGIEYTRQELAKKLNYPIETILFYERFYENPVSLHKPIGEEEDTFLEDMIPANDKSVEELVEESTDHMLIMNLLENKVKGINLKLTQKDRDIMIKRFGLNGDDPKTLEEVANEYGVTRERIRQVQNKVSRRFQQNPRVAKYLCVPPVENPPEKRKYRKKKIS